MGLMWNDKDPRDTWSRGRIVIFDGIEAFTADFDGKKEWNIFVYHPIEKYRVIAPGCETEE